MDFNFRQYDPQIGRFLSVDPLADQTHTMSPYAAMNNNAASLVDPDGLQAGKTTPEFAWSRSAPLGSAMPEYADEEWRGILSYVWGSRNEGMDWDGGRSFGISAQVLMEIARQHAKNMGSGVDGSVNVNWSYMCNFADWGNYTPAPNSVVLPEVVIKEKGFFGKLWSGIKDFVNSIEIEGNIVYSVGVQAGVGIETPVGGLGFEANAFSVDLASAKDLINGVNDGKTDHIGKDYWMNLRQGFGLDFIVGGASIEREMRSPVNGGAFYDKKVTKEVKLLGFFDKTEYYQPGLYTTPTPPAPTHTNGLKFGFNFQFLFGAKVDFEIRRK